jgi:hypothetical protein
MSTDSTVDLLVAGGASGSRTVIPGDLVMRQTAPARMGQATLTGGKAQVFTAAITATSYIFVTPITPGGTTGVLVAKNIGGTDRSAGNWFFVSSMKTDGTLQSADTSTFNWLLIELI